MAQPINLRIPAATVTVKVQIIDTTSHIAGLDLSRFVTPIIPGFTEINCPAFCFLVSHSSGRKVLFDLGVRKDVDNFSPRILKMMKAGNWQVNVQKGVREQLEDNGVNGAEVEAVIWSHWHWDHTGDVSTFPASTALVVGPGFKKAFLPAYPINPESPLLETDFAGRELREIDFSKDPFKIGNFDAMDYFGDGSFYLLDSPGHAIGHICGLARVTASSSPSGSDSFIFMGGDTCHHGGEFRPSKYLPLPDSIHPHPLLPSSAHNINSTPCPGSFFEHLLPGGDVTRPFMDVADLPDGKSVAHDAAEAMRTIGKVQEADASEQIFVVMAHDETLMGVVDFFPKYANDFVAKGWVKEGRWAFLRDFKGALKDGQ